MIVVTLAAAGCSSGHPTARSRAVPVSDASDTSAGPARKSGLRSQLARSIVNRAVDPARRRPYHGARLPDVLHAPLEFPGTKNVVQAHRSVDRVRRQAPRRCRFLEREPAARLRRAAAPGARSLKGVLVVRGRRPAEASCPANIVSADLDLRVASGGNDVVLHAGGRGGRVGRDPRPVGRLRSAHDHVLTLTVVHRLRTGQAGRQASRRRPTRTLFVRSRGPSTTCASRRRGRATNAG